MNKCKNCGKEIDIKNKFCNRSCAATFNNKHRKPRTKESRNKTSVSVKKIQKEKPQLIEQFIKAGKEANKIKSLDSKITTKCEICNKEIEYTKNKPKKYCSETCRNKGLSNKALNQLKKGNGKKGYYKGIWCDSTYELAFLIYHIENNIKIERCKETFDYVYNNKNHKYIPDFIVNDIIYEIKGYYNDKAKVKHEAANKIKLVKLLLKKDLEIYFDFIKKEFDIDKDMLHTLYDNTKMEIKICDFCKKEYSSNNKRFCSIKCSSNSRFKENFTDSISGRFE